MKKKTNKNKYYNCRICLENYEYDDKVTITNCSHNFHSECLGKWIKTKGSCPLCQKNFLGQENGKNTIIKPFIHNSGWFCILSMLKKYLYFIFRGKPYFNIGFMSPLCIIIWINVRAKIVLEWSILLFLGKRQMQILSPSFPLPKSSTKKPILFQ